MGIFGDGKLGKENVGDVCQEMESADVWLETVTVVDGWIPVKGIFDADWELEMENVLVDSVQVKGSVGDFGPAKGSVDELRPATESVFERALGTVDGDLVLEMGSVDDGWELEMGSVDDGWALEMGIFAFDWVLETENDVYLVRGTETVVFA